MSAAVQNVQKINAYQIKNVVKSVRIEVSVNPLKPYICSVFHLEHTDFFFPTYSPASLVPS